MENKELNLQIIQHRMVLKNLAYKFTKDHDEVQDLVQETLTRALKYIDQFVQNPKVISWLFVIMKNIYINNYRRLNQQHLYENHKLSLYQDMGCQEPFTVNTVTNSLIVKDVKTYLQKLPKEYSDLFLKYVNGYKYRELSKIYGIPEGTIKSRIHLIRKKLQKNFAV